MLLLLLAARPFLFLFASDVTGRSASRARARHRQRAARRGRVRGVGGGGVGLAMPARRGPTREQGAAVSRPVAPTPPPDGVLAARAPATPPSPRLPRPQATTSRVAARDGPGPGSGAPAAAGTDAPHPSSESDASADWLATLEETFVVVSARDEQRLGSVGATFADVARRHAPRLLAEAGSYAAVERAPTARLTLTATEEDVRASVASLSSTFTQLERRGVPAAALRKSAAAAAALAHDVSAAHALAVGARVRQLEAEEATAVVHIAHGAARSIAEALHADFEARLQRVATTLRELEERARALLRDRHAPAGGAAAGAAPDAAAAATGEAVAAAAPAPAPARDGAGCRATRAALLRKEDARDAPAPSAALKKAPLDGGSDGGGGRSRCSGGGERAPEVAVPPKKRIPPPAPWKKRTKAASADPKAKKVPAVQSLPADKQRVLAAWFRDHFVNPYASADDKARLARSAGLTVKQVSDWLTNARSRVWRPFMANVCAGL